jgi:hypothetical protein
LGTLKERDDTIKAEMAAPIVVLAKCCAAEAGLVDEVQATECNPPVSFQPMRPNFIGMLGDPNSSVSFRLSDLAKYFSQVNARNKAQCETRKG